MTTLPPVENFITSTAGGRYRVLAYRRLTRAEVVAAVRAYLAQPGTPVQPKRGEVLTIISALGSAGR